MSIEIKVQLSEAKTLERRIRKAAKGFQDANRRAINDTTKQLGTQIRLELRKKFAAKTKYLTRRMWVRKAKKDQPVGSVHFGIRYKIPLRAFPKRQGKKGVSVTVLKGGKRTTYGSAFIIKGQRTTKSGKTQNYDVGVFRRAGRDRLPIQRVQGINPVGVLNRSGIFPKLRAKAPAMLEKNIQKRHRLAALRAAKKVK